MKRESFSPVGRPGLILMSLGALLFAGVAVWVMRWRRGRGPSVSRPAARVVAPPSPPITPYTLPIEPVGSPLPAAAPAGLPPLARWLIFAGVAIGLAVGLLLLPPEQSSLAFLVVGGASLIYGLAALGFRYRGTLSSIPHRMGALTRTTFARQGAWIDAHRRRLVVALALACVGLVALAARQVQPDVTQFWRGNNQGLYIAAASLALTGLLLYLALFLARRTPAVIALPVPGAAILTPVRTDWRSVGVGFGLLAVLMEINGQVFHLAFLSQVSHHVQFVLLVAGIGLVVRGFGGGARADLGLRGVSRNEWLLVIGLTLAALIVRFYLLDSSVRVFVDELNFSTALRTFWYEDSIKLLQPFSGMIAFPWLFPYLQADAVAVLGRSFLGLRAASAIMGALTVPALYLLARTLFDRWTAILAAILLITFPPHVHFSRLGLNNIADPLFGTLALAFLARGMRHGRRVDFALGGAMLGLTQYFYEGGRLLYPAVIVGWAGLVAILWRRKLNWRGLVVAGVVALIVALPIYYTLWGTDRPVAPRMSIVGMNAGYETRLNRYGNPAEAYLVHLVEATLLYVSIPDGSGFYGGETALLLVYAAAPFFLGVLHVLRRWRRPGALLLLLWLAGTSLGNSLLIASQHATRFVVAFPALVLLAALGMRYTLPLILPARRKRLLAWTMIVLAVAIASGQAIYYFGTHIDAFKAGLPGGMNGDDAILRAAQLRPGTRAYLISDETFGGIYARSMLAFFADNIFVDVITPADLEGTIGLFPHDSDYVFFLEPEDWQSLDILRRYFILMPPEYTSDPTVPYERALQMFYAPCCLITPDTPLPVPATG